MKKKNILIASIMIVGVILTALCTVLILKQLSKDDVKQNNNSSGQSSDESSQSKTLEQQAIDLMSTDQQGAINKFKEAEESYLKEDNPEKASEMKDSAGVIERHLKNTSNQKPTDNSDKAPLGGS